MQSQVSSKASKPLLQTLHQYRWRAAGYTRGLGLDTEPSFTSGSNHLPELRTTLKGSLAGTLFANPMWALDCSSPLEERLKDRDSILCLCCRHYQYHLDELGLGDFDELSSEQSDLRGTSGIERQT